MVINEIENRKTIEKNQWKQKLILENIKEIDKPLAGVTKMKREKTQIIRIRNKRGDIAISLTEIKKIIKYYNEQL